MEFKIKLYLTFLIVSVANCKLAEFVKWQSINYMDLPNSWDPSYYNASVNVPFGIAHYKSKLFVAVPRRNRGVPSTLNVVELSGNAPYINPLLRGYPNYQMNTLNPSLTADVSKIVSVYRPRVDRCDRLWFVDTGVLEYSDNQINVQRPSIWTIELNTNTVVGRFEIPSNIVPNGKGLASVTIDDDDCANSFAYLPDWLNNVLIVYSAQQNKAWRFNHNYFHFNPFEGDFSVDGLQFQWTDGIFSIALSTMKPNGYKTAFFHPLASTGEFTVTTEVLRNEALSRRTTHGKDFKFLGQRGIMANSGNHAFDANSHIMFFADMQKNSVSCWNIRDQLKSSNVRLVTQNNITMIYPVDLSIDNESYLWVLSNRLPRFIYSRLDPQEFNFHIFRGATSLAGSSCAGGLGSRTDTFENDDE